jgi:hypothetical protein
MRKKVVAEESELGVWMRLVPMIRSNPELCLGIQIAQNGRPGEVWMVMDLGSGARVMAWQKSDLEQFFRRALRFLEEQDGKR